MSFTAFILILCSAALHATWNLLSKAQRPSLVFYMQSSGTAAMMWMPFLLIHGVSISALPGKFFLLYLGSLFFEILYFASLANAYRRSDISMAYPMARSLPVLLTAMITVIFGLGEPPTFWCWLGMLLIALGCLIIPLNELSQFKLKTYVQPMIIFIILAACGTTGYTVLDSLIMSTAQQAYPETGKVVHSCLYLGCMELSICTGMGIAILFTPSERKEFKKYFFRTPYPSISGICSTAAYCLVLLAMNYVTNVSFVQAFRQLSLPICVLCGVIFLNEKFRLPRLIGFCFIFGGLLLSIF